jgi:ribosomal protein L40E
MSSADPACIRCGAELAPDQEYCLECGARQDPPAGPQWRRPLIAAAVTVALAALVLMLGYERMRDDAKSEAAANQAGGGKVVRQAAANGPEDGTGNRKPVPVARLAAGKSP